LSEEVEILESVFLLRSSHLGSLFTTSRFFGVLEEHTAQIVWKKAAVLPRHHKQQRKRVAGFRNLVLYVVSNTLYVFNAPNGMLRGTLSFPEPIVNLVCGKTASVKFQDGTREGITEEVTEFLEETP
jgi:hypothetical protein